MTGRIRRAFCGAWRCFWRRRDPWVMLIGGGILLLLSAVVRGVCGSPYRGEAVLFLRSFFPPIWLLSLLWSAWYFVLGALFGGVMLPWGGSRVISFRCSERYFGGMLFVAMILLGFLWYPLFFVAARYVLCFLLGCLIFLLCLGCAYRYFRVSALFGTALLLYGGFLLWLLFLNARLLFWL